MRYKIILTVFFNLSIHLLFSQKTIIGNASFYADKFDGRKTANGEVFSQNKLTAAHRTFPFGTKVRVTNLENKKTVEVIINDRGPFVNSRIIDVSKIAAQKLDFINKGITQVKIEVLNDNSYQISEENKELIPTKDFEKVVQKTSNVNYYVIDSQKKSPKGFGIQVASYKEAANLIKRCDEIRTKTSKDVLVAVSEVNGVKVYRIFLGTFSTREKASHFNKKLKNKFKGSFVISF